MKKKKGRKKRKATPTAGRIPADYGGGGKKRRKKKKKVVSLGRRKKLFRSLHPGRERGGGKWGGKRQNECRKRETVSGRPAMTAYS